MWRVLLSSTYATIVTAPMLLVGRAERRGCGCSCELRRAGLQGELASECLLEVRDGGSDVMCSPVLSYTFRR